MPTHGQFPPWLSTLAFGKTQVSTQVPKPVVEQINKSENNETTWAIKSIRKNGKIKLEWTPVSSRHDVI